MLPCFTTPQPRVTLGPFRVPNEDVGNLSWLARGDAPLDWRWQEFEITFIRMISSLNDREKGKGWVALRCVVATGWVGGGEAWM